jgi:hypothetical protein
MGMLPSHIALLAREHSKHPIRGSVLTLGQQAVYASLEEVEQILESQGIPLPVLKKGSNVTSKVGKGSVLWDRRTNAQTVLSLLGAKEVFACDCSTYEDPDFLMDLNLPVDSALFERFDVILDIGTTEHIFNVPMVLRNLNYMLKKGGEIILCLPSSNSIDHGFYSFSPTFFFDFFTANRFNNFRCYLNEADPRILFLGMPPALTRVYQYHRVGPQLSVSSSLSIETVFLPQNKLTVAQMKLKRLFRVPIQIVLTGAVCRTKKMQQYRNRTMLRRKLDQQPGRYIIVLLGLYFLRV